MDLKPQEPAQGISLIHKGPDFATYRVDCNCGNDDDSIIFEVEVTDWQEIEVSHYTTQKTPWWSDPFKQNQSFDIKNELLYNIVYSLKGFLNAIAHRLKVTYSVWVKGYVKYESTTILTQQQALNYSATLQKAVQDVEDFKKSRSS